MCKFTMMHALNQARHQFNTCRTTQSKEIKITSLKENWHSSQRTLHCCPHPHPPHPCCLLHFSQPLYPCWIARIEQKHLVHLDAPMTSQVRAFVYFPPWFWFAMPLTFSFWCPLHDPRPGTTTPHALHLFAIGDEFFTVLQDVPWGNADVKIVAGLKNVCVCLNAFFQCCKRELFGISIGE